MNAKSVTTRFPKKDAEIIDTLVKKGFFTNRSDFIRSAVRQYLKAKGLTVPPIIGKTSAIADVKGITREDIIRETRKVRRDVYKEEYGK